MLMVGKYCKINVKTTIAYLQDILRVIDTMGVNLYTFGVALSPPNADFGPSNGALGPRNVFF